MAYDLSENDTAVSGLFGVAIEGNVLPPQWLQHLTFKNGKPNVNAALILADLVYWYRPVIRRDPATGKIAGLQKKFRGDLLQRSYADYADLYGLTKRQARAAFDCLESIGVIWRDFRTVETAGTRLGNVMFVGLRLPKLFEITHIETPMTLERHTPMTLERHTPVTAERHTPMTLERQTNTETTITETTEYKKTPRARAKPREKPQAAAKPQANVLRFEFPAVLDVDAFHKLFWQWLTHLTGRGKTVTQAQGDLLLEELARHGLDGATAMIKRSLASGWVTLPDLEKPKAYSNGRPYTNGKTKLTSADISAAPAVPGEF